LLGGSGEIKKDGVDTVKCKRCGSIRGIIKYGFNKTGIQCYLCKACRSKFIPDNGFLRMQYRARIIEISWRMYYEGLSLRKIKRHLKLSYGLNPSHTTIYRWILKYSRLLKSFTDEFKLNLSNIYCADEMRLDFGGENVGEIWFWDMIDLETRFLIASKLSEGRKIENAVEIFEECKAKTRKFPQAVITDGLSSYPPTISNVFNRPYSKPVAHLKVGPSKHMALGGMSLSNNRMERVQGTIRERYKVMRGFGALSPARTLMDGFTVYYNFFRPHQALKNRVPAKLAGIKLDYSSKGLWREMVEMATMN